MAEKNVLTIIGSAYSRLTRSGKKVADFVLANSEDAQYMSITTMAEDCHVAEATISRFCQTLGFYGYNSFKLELAKSAVAVSSNTLDFDIGSGTFEKISKDDSITDMAKKLYAADISAIEQTLGLVDEVAVSSAVKYLSKARRVFCFGQGGSLIIAMEAWARFITVAPQFQYIEDSHLQAMAASLCDEEDVILFFSYSGATKDMLDVMRPAKARGAKIILLTHFAKSPGAAYADVILLCGSKEGPLQSGSIPAKMGLLFIIDVLYQEYCRENSQAVALNREITAGAISGKLL